VWRIPSALSWAFCDYDSESVKADIDTMPQADRERLFEELRGRAIQFQLFMEALEGSIPGHGWVDPAIENITQTKPF
jgi:hypothetical protein